MQFHKALYRVHLGPLLKSASPQPLKWPWIMQDNEMCLFYGKHFLKDTFIQRFRKPVFSFWEVVCKQSPTLIRLKSWSKWDFTFINKWRVSHSGEGHRLWRPKSWVWICNPLLVTLSNLLNFFVSQFTHLKSKMTWFILIRLFWRLNKLIIIKLLESFHTYRKSYTYVYVCVFIYIYTKLIYFNLKISWNWIAQSELRVTK